MADSTTNLTTRIVSHLGNMATTAVKSIRVWLNGTPTITDVRPIQPDVHLNSVEAISVWLKAIDQPCSLCITDWYKYTTRMETGGGTSREDEE